MFDFPPGKPAAIEEKLPAESDSTSHGPTSGEGWSLSGNGDGVQAEEKGKAKSKKGKGRAAAAPDEAEAAKPPAEAK